MWRALRALPTALLLSFAGDLGPAPAAAAGPDHAGWCAPLAADAALLAEVDPLDTLFTGLVVFATFPDSRSGLLPAYADSLPGELARYLAAQSRGRWRTDIRLVRRADAPDSAWRAPRPAAEYAGPSGLRFAAANRDVLRQVGEQAPGLWQGVDQVWVIHDQCTFPCSDNRTRDTCEDTCPFGGIAALGVSSADVPGLESGGTTQRRYTRASEVRDHAIQASFAAHEFGHRLRSSPHAPGSDAPGADWVNFGRYDLLRSGVHGAAAREEGLLPYSPLHLARWGWLPRLVVDRDTLGLPLADVMGPRGQLIEIVTRRPRQRFVLSAHGARTPYDARFGGAGVLAWHVLRSEEGLDQRWDIESAAGRFLAGAPDAVYGRDPLEADPLALGSHADLFVAGAAEVLGPQGNPSSRLHASDDFKAPETECSGVAIEHLRADAAGDGWLVDIWVTPAQTLLAPQAGERIGEGEPLRVRWQPRPSAGVASVRIELSLDDGGRWQPLADGLSNSGEWSGWPAAASESARVRLVSRDSSGAEGVRVSGRFALGALVPPAPSALRLSPPAPNPSRGVCRLRFALPSPADARVRVLDLVGRHVRVLAAGPREAGEWELSWDGRDDAGRPVAAGLYRVRIEAAGEAAERRLLRLGGAD